MTAKTRARNYTLGCIKYSYLKTEWKDPHFFKLSTFKVVLRNIVNIYLKWKGWIWSKWYRGRVNDVLVLHYSALLIFPPLQNTKPMDLLSEMVFFQPKSVTKVQGVPKQLGFTTCNSSSKSQSILHWGTKLHK